MAKKLDSMPEPVKQEKGAKCSITREAFFRDAKPFAVKLGDGAVLTANVKDFSTGSFGFRFDGKITLMIGEVPVEFVVGCNITAVGSKKEEKAAV